MKTTLTLSIIVMMTILIYSCKHEKMETTEFNHAAQDLPRVVNGRLYFSDIPELRKYYNYLSERVKTFDGTKYATVEDMLLAIEAEAGHQSLRSILEADENIANRDSLADFILDDLRESILNEHYEVQVADFVMVYMSENQVYQIPIGNTHDINLLRETPKGNDNLLLLAQLDVNSKLESKSLWWFRHRGAYSDCQLDAVMTYGAISCQPNIRRFNTEIKLKMTNQDESTFTVPIFGTLTINFGDNSPELVIHDIWVTEFSHTYPGSGSYPMTVDFSYPDPCSGYATITERLTTKENNLVNIGGGDCANVCLSIVNHDESNGKRMTSEAWIRHDFFGEHQGATTKSYEWQWHNNSYKWRPEAANVKAEINWHFRNNFCQDVGDPIWASGLETEHCNSCNYRRACRTHMGDGDLAIGDDEVFSLHRVENEGVVLQRNITFSICD